MKELVCTSTLIDQVITIELDINNMPVAVSTNMKVGSVTRAFWLDQARTQVKRQGFAAFKKQITDNNFTIEERDL